MKAYRIAIELEDKTVRVVIGRGTGRKARIESAHSCVLPEHTCAHITEALRRCLDGLDLRDAKAFVAVSDRRIVPGRVTRAKPPRGSELNGVLHSEAMRVGMFAEEEDIVIGYVEKPRTENGMWSAFFETAPQSIVDDALRAVKSAGIDSIYYAAIESVLATGLAGSREPVAILEVRGERARLVLARFSEVLAARRIRLPMALDVGEGGSIDVTMPLAMEVIRSLEFFRENGHPEPTEFLLVGDIVEHAIDPEMWNDVVAIPARPAEHPALAVMPVDEPCWLTASMTIFGLPARSMNWLVQPPRRSPARVAGVLTLQLLGAAGIAGGLWLWNTSRGHEEREARTRITFARAQVERLQTSVDEKRLAIGQDNVITQRASLLRDIDAGRVAASHLCVELGADSLEHTQLTKFVLLDSRLELEGRIRAGDRLQALSAFRDLDRRLRALFGTDSSGGRLLDSPSGQEVPFELWVEASTRG